MTSYPFQASEWPKSVARVQDFVGEGERLRLNWDLGIAPEREKKAVIKAWVEKLPDLTHLRRLSIWSQVPPAVLEAACALRGLEVLEIKGTSAETLRPLAQLTQLHSLSIGGATKVESVEPLAALQELRLLEIANFKRVTDFTPLQSLRRLESLAVTGSMWARQDVGSLEPFAAMTWLTSLTLDTSGVDSLRPLAALRQLKRLEVSGRLPMEEYAWLAAHLPTTECRWFAPYQELSALGIGRCPKCTAQTMVMLTGRRAGDACRVCDSAKVRRHAEAFQAAREAAVAQTQADRL